MIGRWVLYSRWRSVDAQGRGCTMRCKCTGVFQQCDTCCHNKKRQAHNSSKRIKSADCTPLQREALGCRAGSADSMRSMHVGGDVRRCPNLVTTYVHLVARVKAVTHMIQQPTCRWVGGWVAHAHARQQHSEPLETTPHHTAPHQRCRPGALNITMRPPVAALCSTHVYIYICTYMRSARPA